MKKLILTVAMCALSACGGATDSGSGAAASPEERGRRAFGQCGACHSAREGDASRIGPNLYGIIGRRAGALEDFAYSTAMRDAGLNWDTVTLDAFLADPEGYVPKNRMALPGGIPDPQRRADLIAYLETLRSDPN